VKLSDKSIDWDEIEEMFLELCPWVISTHILTKT
jgi:hypothetical protein